MGMDVDEWVYLNVENDDTVMHCMRPVWVRLRRMGERIWTKSLRKRLKDEGLYRMELGESHDQ